VILSEINILANYAIALVLIHREVYKLLKILQEILKFLLEILVKILKS